MNNRNTNKKVTTLIQDFTGRSFQVMNNHGRQVTAGSLGIGFGIERLLMVAEGSGSLGRVGRSLAYLDGIRLNI